MGTSEGTKKLATNTKMNAFEPGAPVWYYRCPGGTYCTKLKATFVRQIGKTFCEVEFLDFRTNKTARAKPKLENVKERT